MADEIIAKYKADLKDYNSQIKKGTSQAEKDFEKVDESASGLNKTMGKLGGAIAAAFAVDRIASFTAEASKLAAQGEGVRKAFERIGDPQLLQGLRDATRGTVSDLELMKNAVRASNFKIPLQDLAKLFEFARRRAKETGEEVDYLVNSIVLGIGRKSPLILDNLGISAVELRKRLKGVGVEAANVGDISRIIGDIATEEMRKMGDEADTTADKMQQLAASTENLKEALGTIANETLGPLSQGLATLTQAIADDLTEMDRLRTDLSKASVSDLQTALNREQEILDALEKDLTARIGRISEAQAEIAQNEIDTYRERRDVVQELLDAKQGDLDIDAFTIDNIDKKVKALSELTEEEQKQIKNVAYWRAEIKRLQEELNRENATIDENIAAVNGLTHATEELNKLLGKTKPFKDTLDLEETLPLINDTEAAVWSLGDALKEVFGTEGSDLIQMELDERMRAAEAGVRADQEAYELRKIEAENYYNAVQDVSFATSNAIMGQIQKQTDYELALLQDKVRRGELTEEQALQKSRELKKKEAQFEKLFRSFQIGIAIPQAVMSALAQSPPDKAGAVAAGVIGALQLGLVAAEPIPAFAKGTKDAPSGFKWVGEEGPELIYDQGGYPIITHRESMKIMEKYNIPSIDYKAVERGGFENMAQSATLNGFNDSNMLTATDRLRESNKRGFIYMADRISSAMRKSTRNEW